jgi:hypothetical protein
MHHFLNISQKMYSVFYLMNLAGFVLLYNI